MSKKWFTIAKGIKPVSNNSFDAIEEAGGKPPSKQKLCTLRKLAKLPEDLGTVIDDLEVPWNICGLIAHAPTSEERDERARQAIAAMLDKRESSSHPDRLAKVVCRDSLRRVA